MGKAETREAKTTEWWSEKERWIPLWGIQVEMLCSLES